MNRFRVFLEPVALLCSSIIAVAATAWASLRSAIGKKPKPQ